jgi:carbon monoxide dehydrogenase subunit G
MKKISFLLLIWSALFMQIAMAEPAVDEDIEVKVKIAGESVTVDLSLVVPATRQEVWSVLTDFGHMADFISNLKESRVISTSGNTLKIFQRGVATYGPINFPFESTREIRLTPFDKIKSHMISGNMRKMEGMTRLVDEGGQTRIIYHTDTIQEVWVPPLAGNLFIEHEIREQFKEMRNEIMKRKRVNTPSTPIKIPAH